MLKAADGEPDITSFIRQVQHEEIVRSLLGRVRTRQVNAAVMQIYLSGALSLEDLRDIVPYSTVDYDGLLRITFGWKDRLEVVVHLVISLFFLLYTTSTLWPLLMSEKLLHRAEGYGLLLFYVLFFALLARP